MDQAFLSRQVRRLKERIQWNEDEISEALRAKEQLGPVDYLEGHLESMRSQRKAASERLKAFEDLGRG